MDALKLYALSILAATAIAGCGASGPQWQTVRGRVTYRGEVLTTGSVTFVPQNGCLAASVIEEDGTYCLQAVAGTYRVVITAVPPPPPGTNPMASPQGYVPPQSLIPVKYGRVNTSELVVKVEPIGDNVINLNLQ